MTSKVCIYSGRPGSGKTTMLANSLMATIYRNQKYYEKTGKVRLIYTNFHLRPDLEELFGGALRHWQDLSQLEVLEDCDIFIDEIANYFDAQHWTETSLSIKRWLQQHRHLGVEIYGTTQDFAQVDISFRRMVSDLYYIVKLASSRDPSPTKPPVKWVWGISVIYSMSPTDYKEDQKENRCSFSSLMWIDRDKVEIFDTREKILPGKYPPLRHTERKCTDPTCKFKRVVHS